MLVVQWVGRTLTNSSVSDGCDIDFGCDDNIVCGASWGKSKAIVCIMLIITYTCYMRFKNVLMETTKCPTFIPESENSGSLNRHQ